MLTAAVVLGINAGWDKYQEFRQAELARVMTVKDKKFDPGQLTEMAAALAAKPYVRRRTIFRTSLRNLTTTNTGTFVSAAKTAPGTAKTAV